MFLWLTLKVSLPASNLEKIFLHAHKKLDSV